MMEDLTFSLLKAAGLGGYLLPREEEESKPQPRKKRKKKAQSMSAGEMLDALDQIKDG